MPIIKKPKTVRIAIVGCGKFAQGNHIKNLLAMENVEIVALYNRSEGNLEETSKMVPKARLYQDLEKMFDKENFDAVVVSLTPTAHGLVEDLCCKKGVHMFIEKPVHISLNEAMEISEKIKLSNIITSAGYQERYSPVLESIKEMISKEPVGLVNAYWIGTLPASQWWRTKELSGGQLVEQATHLADMLRYLFGDADSVYMSGRRNEAFGGQEHDVEDYSSGIINFKSGVVASFQAACYIKEWGAAKLGFEILMPRCRIEYKWGGNVTIYSNSEPKTVEIEKTNHKKCLETFVEAVRTGDRYLVKSSYEDAVKSLAISLKANESMETGNVMKL